MRLEELLILKLAPSKVMKVRFSSQRKRQCNSLQQSRLLRTIIAQHQKSITNSINSLVLERHLQTRWSA
jgi:hypothetical protein